MSPLFFLAVVTSGVSCYTLFDGSWFSYHPITMIMAFILFVASAIHVEKNKQHWLHMILNCVAVLFIGIGFYCIYDVKNQKNKPHFTTTPRLLGLVHALCHCSPNVRWFRFPISFKEEE